MRKRLISTLTCFSMLLGALSTSLAFAESDAKADITDSNTAYAVFGDNLESVGFETVKIGPVTDKRTVSERQGRKCWTIQQSDGFNSERICMTFTDEFKAGAKTGDSYDITVEWYDDIKNGYFYIGYDGYDRSEKVDHDRTEEIYTKGDGIWKTSTFHIDNAKFEEEMPGNCDMFLGTTIYDHGWHSSEYVISPAPIHIAKITVTKNVGENPIRANMEIDAAGNAFPWFGEKVIHNTLTNTLDRKVDAKVTFKAENMDGYCAYSETQDITFEPGEVKNLDVDFKELQRCDMYDYVIEVEPADGSFHQRVKRKGFVVLKTDPDGIINEGQYYASHINAYAPEEMDAAYEVMRLGNVAGVRGDNGWYLSEQSAKEYTVNYSAHDMAKEVQAKGMTFMPIVLLGHPNYTGSRVHLPDTEAEFEAAAKWLDWWLPRVKDVYGEYEYWNEPLFTTAFCPNYDTDNYLRGYRLLLEKVKQYDPGEPVAVLSYTDLANGSRKTEFEKLLELGIAEDIRGNAISLHGYTRSVPEGSLPTAGVNWYVDKLKEYGVERDEYELWMTEFGSARASGDAAEFDAKLQGAHTLRTYLEYMRENQFDKYVMYKFESDGESHVNRESVFGHVTTGSYKGHKWEKVYVPTEAYIQVAAFNYVMAQGEFKAAPVSKNNLRVAHFESEKFGKDYLVLNTLNGSELLTLDLGCNSVLYLDEYGNEQEIYSADGIYTFTVDDYPEYVIGDFKRVQEVEKHKFNVSNFEADVAQNDEFSVIFTSDNADKYTVEVKETEYAKVLENTGFANGKATVRLKSYADFGEENLIEFIIKNGDKTVAAFDIKAEVVQIASSEMNISLASKTNLNKWTAVTTIKNTSGTKCISGDLRIISPNNLILKEPIKLGYIPAGKTAEVSFALPDITKKGRGSIGYEIELSNGEVIGSSINIDTSVADYAHKKPTIDGVISPGEWNVGTAMATDSVDDVLYSTGWTGATWKGTNDQSGVCYVAWDEEKLYLCWDVTDDVFVQNYDDASIWNGDGIQLGVYYGNHDEFVAAGNAAMAFHEVGVALTKNGPEMYRWSSQNAADQPAGAVSKDKYELAITREGNKTVYEWAIRWENLLNKGQQPKEGDKLGFSYLINEDDGAGRRGAMRYADGIFFSKDTTQFSYINLIKSEVK